eukprot:550616_1
MCKNKFMVFNSVMQTFRHKMLLLMFIVFQTISFSTCNSFSPSTDPKNVGNWILVENLSDEFETNELNQTKWYNYNPRWMGRQPGLFWPDNVRINNNTLQLWANHTILNSTYSSKGYQNYTTSSVVSKYLFKYGYVEVKSKAGTSKISSSFWFHWNNHNGSTTEIDIFEESGYINQTEYYYDTLFTHTHIDQLPNTNTSQLPKICNCTLKNNGIPCSQGSKYPGNKLNVTNFSDDYHIYGMNWNQNYIAVYFDTILVWNITNLCLHEEFPIIFDRETMGDWFGMPPFQQLPDQPFTIEYVRTWVQS